MCRALRHYRALNRDLEGWNFEDMDIVELADFLSHISQRLCDLFWVYLSLLRVKTTLLFQTRIW